MFPKDQKDGGILWTLLILTGLASLLLLAGIGVFTVLQFFHIVP